MNNLLATIGIVISAGAMQAQVNVYECGVTNPSVSSAEVLNGAFGFYRPCIVFDANTDFLFSGDVHKDIKASEYIHIKEGFHAGLFNAGKGVHLRIDEKALYDVSVLNYPDLNAIEKYKKVEFGVDLEGEIEDRIKAFINLTDGTAPTLYHLNPFIEDDMNDLTSEISMHATFIHPQTWTVKERDFFYYHEYEQIGPSYGVDIQNEDTGELGWSDAINDNNDYLMRVRFAPPRVGEWEAHFSITYDGNTIELPVFTFLVQDNNHPGFVKVHYNQRNLDRENGIVFPVGHVFPGPYNRANGDQVAWGELPYNKSEYNTTVADWNQYLGDIESYIDQGGKSIKLAQTSYGNLIEFEELGNYRKRLHYAWEQDKILEMCEENDVLINFNLLFQDVIMGYGQNGSGSVGDPWDYGTYGPDRQPDFMSWYPNYCYFVDGTLPSNQFLDPVLMNYHKQRTRYYVARYGYSPQIYTWELMSEPFHMDEFNGGKIIAPATGGEINDAPAGEINHPGHQTAILAINTYHIELSNYLKNVLKDNDHLITLDQAIAVADKPVNESIYPYQCAYNPLIDILGLNNYSERVDKLIIGKEDKNGKENLIFSEGETSIYKVYREILDTIGYKPIILSEMGETIGRTGLKCYENIANEINVMTYGFTGVAGMHPWEGYQYGNVDPSGQLQYDERQLWTATIAAEKHMNSEKVLRVLNHWNGWWNQGRQIAKIKENPVNGITEDKEVKELQYYISQSRELAAGYVRNRSYNPYTAKNCISYDTLSYPFWLYYLFQFDDGPEKNHLYLKGLEKHTLYQTRWFDYITGTELPVSNIQESDNQRRIKLQYPTLTLHPNQLRPILWFTTEKLYVRPESANQTEEIRTQVTENNQFNVFPNPFNEEIKIISERGDQINIYSIAGRLVITLITNNTETNLSTSNLEKGIYFVHSSQSNETIKIVKQ